MKSYSRRRVNSHAVIFVYNSSDISVFFLDKLNPVSYCWFQSCPLLSVIVYISYCVFAHQRQIASLLVLRPLLCVCVFMLLTCIYSHIALMYKYYNRNSLSLYFHFLFQ